MSLIEAIAVGTPVIGTDVGDVRWLIERTGAGVCVEPGDEDAFDERPASRCSATARCAGASPRRRASGVGEFDAPLMVERYERVLEAAADSAPLPRPLRGPEGSATGPAAGLARLRLVRQVHRRPGRRPAELGCEVVLLTRDHDQEFGGEPGAMREFVRRHARRGRQSYRARRPGARPERARRRGAPAREGGAGTATWSTCRTRWPTTCAWPSPPGFRGVATPSPSTTRFPTRATRCRRPDPGRAPGAAPARRARLRPLRRDWRRN